MSQELSNALAQLAAKLGTSVEHLWPLLVRKAYIDAWMLMAFALGLIFAGLSMSAYGYGKLRKAPTDVPYVERTTRQDIEVSTARGLTFIPLLVALVGVIIAITDISDICVPEVSAIKNLLP